MKRCPECADVMERRVVKVRRKLEEHVFMGQIPASVCRRCRQTCLDGPELGAFEMDIARQLAVRGWKSGAAFKFMRKALGFPATELARLLNVAAETVSRWETEARDVDRATWTVLCALVIDRVEDRATTHNALRAAAEPQKCSQVIRVKKGNA